MEKIYMEESKEKKQKKSVIDFSVVLSFVIAIFSMFSLAVFGIVNNQGSNISYAVPVTDQTLTFYKGTQSDESSQLFVTAYKGDDRTVFFAVPMYYSQAGNINPIFCIEHNNENVATGTTYTKSTVISDYGLLYLLNNSFVNEKNIVSGTTNKYIEGWITQVAIWMYLYDQEKAANGSVNSTSPNYISDADINAIKQVTKIEVGYDAMSNTYDRDFGESIYTKYIQPLLTAAKNASNIKKLSVTKGSENISKTSDGKFYQSPLVTVTGNPSGDFQKYDVSLSGIEGAFLVDESGNSLTATNITPGKKFYVRVPAEKVTTTIQKIQIGVTGYFNSLTGHTYTSANANHQKIVSVTGTTKLESDGTDVEFVGSPDTGMNMTQTIYFIGLVVLLCGVGIVYANTKAVSVKQ